MFTFGVAASISRWLLSYQTLDGPNTIVRRTTPVLAAQEEPHHLKVVVVDGEVRELIIDGTIVNDRPYDLSPHQDFPPTIGANGAFGVVSGVDEYVLRYEGLQATEPQ